MHAVTYISRFRRWPGRLGWGGDGLASPWRWHRHRPLPLVRRVLLTHPSLPEPFDGLTLAQVSDVHAGQFMTVERLEEVRAVVCRLAPDLILFTGDQLDRRNVDAELFVQAFAGISAPFGVFGVLGNHDYLAGRALALTALEAAGITPLVNEAVLLQRQGATILLAGVDDADAPRPFGPDFTILQEVSVAFRLLACHQPRLWPEAVRHGADLTLAGHTHGGQISPMGERFSVARLATRFVAGPYVSGAHLLYVSRGIGVGAVPLRVGTWPEVDLITLQRGRPAPSL
ncbi:MAG: metallophosphoesterase [Thermoanaerobaculum sp.]|nr:metallophosphoesterase [Thermoanaerobaculum sp.]